MAGTDNKNTGNTTTTTTMDLKRKAMDDDDDDDTSKITDGGDGNPTNKKRAATSDSVSAIAAAAQAEDIVSQLKKNCKHLGVDEVGFNHLDQFIRLVRIARAKVVDANAEATADGTTVTAAATAAATQIAASETKAGGKGGKKKPVLVILPGSSGKLSNDFKEFLVPVLHRRFEVRLRDEKKWKGWDPMKNAQDVCAFTEQLIPADGTDEAEDWYIMGCSFGNRVATAAVAGLVRGNRFLHEEKQRVPPKLILTGYPMYGPSVKNKEARILSLQSLPVGTQVLAISGTNDEFINSDKNVPHPLPSGNPRAVWDSVLQTMPCRATTTVRFIEKGGHGVYPSAKGRKADTTTQLVQYIDTFVKGNNEDDGPTIPTGGVGSGGSSGGNKTITSFFQPKK